MSKKRTSGRAIQGNGPTSLSGNSPRETPAKGFHSAAATEKGEKGRIRAESFADHYSQARQFFLSQTAYEQAHIAAIDFVRDAFGHLTAIAVDEGGRALLSDANIQPDAGIVDANDKDAFISAAKTRQWDREASIRTLA